MQETTRISVLVERVGELWAAQCLEIDLATQGRTLGELLQEIQYLLSDHFENCLRQGLNPFEFPKAPQEFWLRYERADVSARRADPRLSARAADTAGFTPQLDTRIHEHLPAH